MDCPPYSQLFLTGASSVLIYTSKLPKRLRRVSTMFSIGLILTFSLMIVLPKPNLILSRLITHPSKHFILLFPLANLFHIQHFLGYPKMLPLKPLLAPKLFARLHINVSRKEISCRYYAMHNVNRSENSQS